ncbi:Ran GTPase binding protein Sbp1 [Glugoides intestinalis]
MAEKEKRMKKLRVFGIYLIIFIGFLLLTGFIFLEKILNMQNEEIKSIKKVSESLPKKKESPFLSTKEVKETTEEQNERLTIKKQHEDIDKFVRGISIFNTVGKLYFYSKETNKLETRGEGKILILKDKSGMYRLMMIRDLIMLKGCNHYILHNCPLTKATRVKNSWVWKAIQDQSDAEIKEPVTVYFATFKDEEVSDLFEKAYNQAKEENKVFLELNIKKDKERVVILHIEKLVENQ